MGDVVLNVLPLILVAAISPFPIIVNLLLLQREDGVSKATAFIGAIVLVRLVQGVLFGIVIREAESGEPTATRQLITAILLLVVGLLMIISGVRLLLKEDDPDDPPKSTGRLDQITTVKAFGLGLLLVGISAKQWVFMLSSLAVIGEGELGRTSSIVSYLIYVIGATSLLLIPYLARLAIPSRSEPMMRATVAWLERNNRYIKIAVSFLFGIYFLGKALSSLLG